MSYQRYSTRDIAIAKRLYARGLSLEKVRAEMRARAGVAPSNQTIKRWCDPPYAKLIRTRVMLDKRVHQKAYRARQRTRDDQA